MSGLREQQKKQRRETLLTAAMTLFDSHGYTLTTVEQIAAAAGVSTPTVFNYFGNKQEILFALIDRADRSAVDDARSQMAKYDNAVDAMCNLQAMIMQRELETLPLSIWRELMNFTFSGTLSAGMTKLDERLAQEIADLLLELKQRGMLTQNFDADFVAHFLNDYCIFLFARFVQQENPDFAAHHAQVRRVAELVFMGLKP